jgi:hypothetical protein
MFGSTRRLQFLESLTSSRAGEFAGQMENAVQPATEMISVVTENQSDSPGEAVRNIPEMILAENTESIGEQIESRAGGFQSAQDIGRQVSQVGRQAQSMFSQVSGQVSSGHESVTDTAETQPVTQASEVMKRKLNHFQIERLAEVIKDRLESELKVQKERWGEEP